MPKSRKTTLRIGIFLIVLLIGLLLNYVTGHGASNRSFLVGGLAAFVVAALFAYFLPKDRLK